MESNATVKSLSGAACYPEPGKVFELEFDSDAPESGPLDMVPGRSAVNVWEYTGTALQGKHRRQFMLVPLEGQPNLAAVKRVLEADYGPLPEGQWMLPFDRAHPAKDYSERPFLGIADPSWISQHGEVNFPFKDSDGFASFLPEDNRTIAEHPWLWLVFAPANG